MVRYVLRSGWIPAAFAAGAAIGAVGVTVWTALPGAFDSETWPELVGLVLMVFIVSFAIWAFGLLTVGGPAWYEFHHKKRTAPTNALVLGLAATFAITFALSLVLDLVMVAESYGGHVLIADGHRTFYGWLDLIKNVVLLSLLGGVVATVIWRIAYRTER